MRSFMRLSALFFLLCGSFNTLAFDAVSLSAKPTTLERHIKSGKWTLVAVWALDCVACEEQKPELSSMNFKDAYIDVVGLSVDGKSNIDLVKRRLAEKPVSFDNVIVDFDEFKRDYRARFKRAYIGTPTYILYAPNKKVDSIHVGPMEFSNLRNYVQNNTQVNQIIHQDLMR